MSNTFQWDKTFLRSSAFPLDYWYRLDEVSWLDMLAHGGSQSHLTYEGMQVFCLEDGNLYVFKKNESEQFYYEALGSSFEFESISLVESGENYVPSMGGSPKAGVFYRASGTFTIEEESVTVTKYYLWKAEWIEIIGFFSSNNSDSNGIEEIFLSDETTALTVTDKKVTIPVASAEAGSEKDGLFTHGEKTKLADIDDNAEENIIEGVIIDGVTLPPHETTKKVTIPLANASTQDGLITHENQAKLDGIADGAVAEGATGDTHAGTAHAPSDAQKNVQSDWDATEGDALILNKPTISGAGDENVIEEIQVNGEAQTITSKTVNLELDASDIAYGTTTVNAHLESIDGAIDDLYSLIVV